jgi:hypothetical protein
MRDGCDIHVRYVAEVEPVNEGNGDEMRTTKPGHGEQGALHSEEQTQSAVTPHRDNSSRFQGNPYSSPETGQAYYAR